MTNKTLGHAPIYPPDWPEIAEAVKARADWKCQECGRWHFPPNGYTLTVHHKDHNTLNSDPSNLVALCQRCHLRVEGIYKRWKSETDSLGRTLSTGQAILPGMEEAITPTEYRSPYLVLPDKEGKSD